MKKFITLCIASAFTLAPIKIQGESLKNKEFKCENYKDVPSETMPKLPNNNKTLILKDVESDLIKALNSARRQDKINILFPDNNLMNCALYKTKEMLEYNYFSHLSPRTGEPYTFLTSKDITFDIFGENLYTVKTSDVSSINGSEIFKMWFTSGEHRKNILNSKFEKIGVSAIYSSSSETCYIVVQLSD